MPKFTDYIQNFIPLSVGTQFRAIGLVKGVWTPSKDEAQKGIILTSSDGSILDAVMLGKVLKICKHHVLTQEQLFVVYPRTKPGGAHLQIMGIWDKVTSADATDADGYMNIRGEIAYQSKPDSDENRVVVKIRRLPRKEGGKVTFFKLQLKGRLSHYGVGGFWDITCKLTGKEIVIWEAKEIVKALKTPTAKSKAKTVIKTAIAPATAVKKKVILL